MHHLAHARDTRADPAAGPRLACRVTLADGRVFDGPLAPERHRAIHLGLLHADSDGLVELTPGTRGPDGTLAVDRRGRSEHYLPGGAGGHPSWLPDLLAHAERIVTGEYSRRRGGPVREEVFVGVAPRRRRRGGKDAVGATRFLWLDVDRPERLDALWSFLAERPCQLIVETGGSGGVHAYWKLEPALEPLRRGPDGATSEPIEHAHQRIIHALGVDADGRPDVADPRCAERSRVMRLAGTINHKRGAWARVVQADLALAPYRLEDLLDGLPEPAAATPRPPARRGEQPADPYKRIAPAEYFARLAGIRARGGELVRCPAPGHEDIHPSCHVGRDAGEGWCCHAASCGARGAIYDLASVLHGGPWGSALRGEAFQRARRHVAAAFADAAAGPPSSASAAVAPRHAATPDEAGPARELWCVRVRDDVDARIAGHDGWHYFSPPQPRADALTLAALLLGGPLEPTDAHTHWTRAIAGGRRVVDLEGPPDHR